MKKTILLLIVVVGGAFYLGWFTFTTNKSGNTEHVDIIFDKDKIHEDELKAFEKLNEYEQQLSEQAEKNAATNTDTSAATGSTLR
ncbi:MAG TPA: hypothetical protein VFW87_03270 [Pirellulales bacterium]|nr:hypothetical protein [Pirellulales bacterium]